VANIGDFVGTYTIRNVLSPIEEPLLQVGGQLLIGTNSEYGDRQPSLTDGGYIVTGFAVLSPEGQPLLATSDEQGTPLQLALVESNLRWVGWYKNRPLRIYISTYEINSPGGVRTRGLYGSTVAGDPEQVGVWGADDTPTPPTPKKLS
jgi:hypothetical protein